MTGDVDVEGLNTASVGDELPPPVGETIHENIDRLIGDLKGVIAAERAYWKTRMRYSKSLAKQTAILFGGAIALAASAFTALILGMLLVLSARIGPIGATALVTLVTLSIASVMAWLALRRLRRLTFAKPGSIDAAEHLS